MLKQTMNQYIYIAGLLNVDIYDGFFFRYDETFERYPIDDNMEKDIQFCAQFDEFSLTVSSIII